MNVNGARYFLFATILGYIPLWMQIGLFLSSLGKSKWPITIVKDERIRKLLLTKTGVRIDHTKISESALPFGMMIGIPGMPQLILSRALYKNFSQSELEYILLHEAGHYALVHSMKELLAGVLLLIVGIAVLSKLNGPFGLVVSPLIGLVFGILMIQFGRLKEVEADAFALKRISDPNGMISATEKLREAYENHPGNKLIRFLFTRGNPYENRIAMATSEIERRK